MKDLVSSKSLQQKVDSLKNKCVVKQMFPNLIEAAKLVSSHRLSDLEVLYVFLRAPGTPMLKVSEELRVSVSLVYNIIKRKCYSEVVVKDSVVKRAQNAVRTRRKVTVTIMHTTFEVCLIVHRLYLIVPIYSIADVLGVSKQTISNILRRRGPYKKLEVPEELAARVNIKLKVKKEVKT